MHVSQAKDVNSICPCHPGEARDARFVLLDALIDAGWGSVPMYLIDRAIEENGGVLPPRPALFSVAALEAPEDETQH